MFVLMTDGQVERDENGSCTRTGSHFPVPISQRV